ncbi:MAG: hypothetical protein ACREWG_06730, partial [Gammaproteobacteria bacterium]
MVNAFLGAGAAGPRPARDYDYYRRTQRENDSTARRYAAEDAARYERQFAAFNSRPAPAQPSPQFAPPHASLLKPRPQLAMGVPQFGAGPSSYGSKMGTMGVPQFGAGSSSMASTIYAAKMGTPMAQPPAWAPG